MTEESFRAWETAFREDIAKKKAEAEDWDPPNVKKLWEEMLKWESGK